MAPQSAVDLGSHHLNTIYVSLAQKKGVTQIYATPRYKFSKISRLDG